MHNLHKRIHIIRVLVVKINKLLSISHSQIFPPMVKVIGLYGCMWFFSAVCLLGTIITFVFIPETKGKSLIAPINVDEKAGNDMLNLRAKPVQIISSH